MQSTNNILLADAKYWFYLYRNCWKKKCTYEAWNACLPPPHRFKNTNHINCATAFFWTSNASPRKSIFSWFLQFYHRIAQSDSDRMNDIDECIRFAGHVNVCMNETDVIIGFCSCNACHIRLHSLFQASSSVWCIRSINIHHFAECFCGVLLNYRTESYWLLYSGIVSASTNAQRGAKEPEWWQRCFTIQIPRVSDR